MLIDYHSRYAAVANRLCPSITKTLGTYRYTAQRFRFSDEVVRSVAQLTKDYPHLLMRNYQFAVPPYPTTYIEYNVRVWAEEMGKSYYKVQDETSDQWVSYLIHDSISYTLSAVKYENPFPSPFAFGLTHGVVGPRPLGILRIEGDYGGHAETAMASLCLGATFFADGNGVTDEIVADISNRISVWIDLGLRTVSQANISKLISQSRGEVRNIWALLLWINQPQHMIFDDVPAQRFMIGNKSIASPRHRLVRLRPKVTVHQMNRVMQLRMKPGLHDVRQFWRNFDKSDNCDHDWPMLPDEFGQFHCQRCSQWRVRVKEHKRGDPSRPVIRRGYEL